MKLNPHCLNKNRLGLIFLCLFIGACGVKGRPQPPSVETPIGYGSPEVDAEQLKKKSAGQNQ